MDIPSIIKAMSRDQKVRLCTGKNNWQTTAYEELGVPSLVMSDGTNGVRFQKGSTEEDVSVNLFDALVNFSFDSEHALSNTYEATCFPTGSALASSWNPVLAGKVGAAVAKECKHLGIGLLLGPGMNIRRHPLTARNFEYYSEDPVLSGEIAAGMVEGIQGEGVGATLKHFACNNSDTRRTKLDCLVEKRALREIYLAGFERAVKKAKPAAVMGSYPAINGVQACEDPWLLTDILRGEWGFEGIVVSDWGAVKNSAAAAAAGLDLQMPFSFQYVEQVNQALDEGLLSEEQLDNHCERLLKLIFHYNRHGKETPDVDWGAQHDLAREAAEECGVLLKNENGILPIDITRMQKVAVLGEAAVRPIFQGTGCAVVNTKNVDIPLDELQRAMPLADISYAAGYLADYTTTNALLEEAADIASKADLAIVIVGSRLPGESDEFDRTDMDLESGHIKLIETVSAAQPNTVIVLCNGDAIAMPWAKDVKGILDMWYAGEGTGRAIAALLTGKANPSGKLAVTIPKTLRDTPAFLDFPHEQDISRYREGIFAGYRYYDTKEVEPLYPFGHGLSYTKFRYESIDAKQLHPGEFEVRIQISNSGRCTGQEVVQLYISPRNPRVFRPLKELKAFEKVLLSPGESKSVTFTLTRRDFAYFNDKCNVWQVDSDIFGLMAGGSSRNLSLYINVEVKGDEVKKGTLTKDSHYSDIFQYPEAALVYFDFLVENGLLLKEQVAPYLEDELEKTFWGFSQHLDMLTKGKLTQDMLCDLLKKMNGAIIR